MAAGRPQALKFKGKYITDADGNKHPDRHFQGVPARDLDALDIAGIGDDEWEQVKANMKRDDPLYEVVEVEEEAPAEGSKSEEAADSKPSTRSRNSSANSGQESARGSSS